MQEKRFHSWRDWYSFARETLGYEPPEATEYANLRYAEELNHSAKNRRGQESLRVRAEKAAGSSSAAA
jgi:hypothetical protein